MDPTQHAECRRLLSLLTSKKMQEQWSWPFMTPVPRETPEYYTIIKKPMDLGTIKRKLGSSPDRSRYQVTLKFVKDVRLVFQNALLYNKADEHVKGSVYDAARHLLDIFEEAFAESPLSADVGSVPPPAQGDAPPAPPAEAGSHADPSSAEGSQRPRRKKSRPREPSVDLDELLDFKEDEPPRKSASRSKRKSRADTGGGGGGGARDSRADGLSRAHQQLCGVGPGITAKEADACASVMSQLMKHKSGGMQSCLPFLHALDFSQFPDYPRKIQRPMHLELINSKLRRREYTCLADFAFDVRLVFANCLVYNCDPVLSADIRKLAVALLKVFEKAYAKAVADCHGRGGPGGAQGPAWPGLQPRWECHNVLEDMLKQRTEDPSAEDGGGGGSGDLDAGGGAGSFQTAYFFAFRFEAYFPDDSQVDHSYYKVVRSPMNLGRVSTNLQLGLYADAAAFAEDVRLVFANCRRFWGRKSEGKSYCDMAEDLESLLDQSLAQRLGKRAPAPRRSASPAQNYESEGPGWSPTAAQSGGSRQGRSPEALADASSSASSSAMPKLRVRFTTTANGAHFQSPDASSELGNVREATPRSSAHPSRASAASSATTQHEEKKSPLSSDSGLKIRAIMAKEAAADACSGPGQQPSQSQQQQQSMRIKVKLGGEGSLSAPEQAGALEILRLLRLHEMVGISGASVRTAGPFLTAVPVSLYPDYLDVVKQPMDLSKVERRLRGGKYKALEEFYADMSLIFSNCYAYNSDPVSGADIRAMASALKVYFEQLFRELRLTGEVRTGELVSDEEPDQGAEKPSQAAKKAAAPSPSATAAEASAAAASSAAKQPAAETATGAPTPASASMSDRGVGASTQRDVVKDEDEAMTEVLGSSAAAPGLDAPDRGDRSRDREQREHREHRRDKERRKKDKKDKKKKKKKRKSHRHGSGDSTRDFSGEGEALAVSSASSVAGVSDGVTDRDVATRTPKVRITAAPGAADDKASSLPVPATSERRSGPMGATEGRGGGATSPSLPCTKPSEQQKTSLTAPSTAKMVAGHDRAESSTMSASASASVSPSPKLRTVVAVPSAPPVSSVSSVSSVASSTSSFSSTSSTPSASAPSSDSAPGTSTTAWALGSKAPRSPVSESATLVQPAPGPSSLLASTSAAEAGSAGKGEEEEVQEWELGCAAVLERMMLQSFVVSLELHRPVLEVHPHLRESYLSYVKKPMDLGTVQENLVQGVYTKPSQFVVDGRLIFDNALAFNIAEDDFSQHIRDIANFLKALWHSFCVEMIPPDVAALAGEEQKEWEQQKTEDRTRRDEFVRELRLRGKNRECSKMIRTLMSQKYDKICWPFRRPVQELFPEIVDSYKEIIDDPMDLSTVSERLLGDGRVKGIKKYATYGEVAEDIRRTFDNALLFNEGDLERAQSHSQRCQVEHPYLLPGQACLGCGEDWNVYGAAAMMKAIFEEIWAEVTLDAFERVGAQQVKKADMARKGKVTGADDDWNEEVERKRVNYAELDGGRLSDEDYEQDLDDNDDDYLELSEEESGRRMTKEQRRAEVKRRRRMKKQEQSERGFRIRQVLDIAFMDALREAEYRFLQRKAKEDNESARKLTAERLGQDSIQKGTEGDRIEGTSKRASVDIEKWRSTLQANGKTRLLSWSSKGAKKKTWVAGKLQCPVSVFSNLPLDE